MIAGAWDDELVGFEIAIEHHLAGFRALDPHVLRHFALDAEEAADFRPDEILDPVQAARLLPRPACATASRPGRSASERRTRAPAVSRRRLARLWSRLSRTALTSAEPTTTASAAAAMARAWPAVLTPKPTAIGSVRLALDARHIRLHLRDVRRLGAGDAEHRDIIDEARGVREDRRRSRWSSVVGVARRMKLRPASHRRQAQLVVLLGRQVDDDQAVDAGRFRRRRESARRRGCRSDCNSP